MIEPQCEKFKFSRLSPWRLLAITDIPSIIENKRQPPDKMHNQVTETDTPILMDIRSFGNVDTFMPPPLPPAQYFFFFSLVIAYT